MSLPPTRNVTSSLVSAQMAVQVHYIASVNQLIFCTRAIGLPPSAQLLGFYFFSTLEIIVRLHEKKPSTLSIADRTCLLQVFFRLVPQDIDAHAAIPRYLAWSAHLGRQSWQNIETTLSGGQSGRPGKEHPRRSAGLSSETNIRHSIRAVWELRVAP